jgi:hypothetical protein
LEITPLFKAYPFKLNSQWLCEKHFNNIVNEVWNDPKFLSEGGKQRRLVWKLKALKAHTKLRVKEIKCRDLINLEKMEDEIKVSLQNLLGGTLLPEEERHHSNLEQERNKYLKAKEEIWRQHSRVIWIQTGDQKTKFFHQFSSYRRNQKHVWEIIDDIGTLQTGHVELEAEAMNYYKNFFKAQEQPSTTD